MIQTTPAYGWLRLPSLSLANLTVGLTVLILVLTTKFIASRIIYNLCYHPLARFPGPLLWKVTRWPYMRAMQRGTLVHEIQKFHEQYEETIRIGPNEISCINPEAWQDIYGGHKSGQTFQKNPLWMSRQKSSSNSILSAKDADHHRIRRLISHAFSEKALREQEPILQQYIGILIQRLHDQVRAGWGSGVVNLVDWYSWTTFDIIGELGFGETFGCLTSSREHEWSSMVFSHFKAASLVTSVRFYPFLEGFLRRCLPSPVKDRQGHFQMSKEKIHRRLKDASKSSRTTGYLLKNPAFLATLVKEIRGTFGAEADINLGAVGKLPYLSAVLEEGLRMAPPVPSGLPRVVPPGGARVCSEWIPGGTNISFNQWSAYRSPLNFKRPNDFLPERWLVSDRSSVFAGDRKSALQPFSFGPRNCIGKNLAYAELRLILARLLWNFDLSFPADHTEYEWSKQRTYVLVEKQPLNVRLSEGKHN
ncbi:related to isotrichodermin C-15 hydroxylase (cytochrome P-450 monooxygenase CYP65A1) [Phialocephala subalpina]|uniref:Related to isotrichodermin C-15 hydroxylase (Cytochrome P-450 monooxygenase CYP65A1) n=1 Tax=Phialocephala subalpina TaxID=576137 RepID=A0A1L7XXX3_9HELO|nr:related to isotrichodermin C-15 hydroxylase (cytochrome P-450 monooxygenase CYP65A1) [Phialocephala subalpina]